MGWVLAMKEVFELFITFDLESISLGRGIGGRRSSVGGRGVGGCGVGGRGSIAIDRYQRKFR